MNTKTIFAVAAAGTMLLLAGCTGDYFVGTSSYSGPYYGGYGPYPGGSYYYGGHYFYGRHYSRTYYRGNYHNNYRGSYRSGYHGRSYHHR